MDVIQLPGTTSSRSPTPQGSIDMQEVRLTVGNGKLFITRKVERSSPQEKIWAAQVETLAALLSEAKITHEVFTHKDLEGEEKPDTIAIKV